MRRFCRYLPLLFVLLMSVQFASAQSGFDVNIGFGSAWDKSLGFLDIGTLNPCTGSLTANCSSTPDLGGFFLGVGGNLMLWKNFGVGMEASFQPGKQDYLVVSTPSAGQFGEKLQTRVTFYDFNGIFQPISTKRAALQLVGGIGGANIKFYDNVSSNSSILGNANSSQFFGSSNHFQLHAGVGVQLYATEHVFIRPQFDLHYVHNFEQFKRNSVPAFMVWLGYSFGDRP